VINRIEFRFNEGERETRPIPLEANLHPSACMWYFEARFKIQHLFILGPLYNKKNHELITIEGLNGQNTIPIEWRRKIN